MELTELKALAEKVTPGPWHWDSDPVKGAPLDRARFRVVAKGRTITQCYYSSGDDMAQREAAYIAAANPAAILELIAQLEDARAAVEADRAQRVPDVDALADKIAECLRGTYHCNRVWEAWHVGTMSQDDFEPVDESETPREIAEEIAALLASTPAQPAQQELEPTKAVAYLDIGTGGYVDLGSELSPEELAALPRGRHMLVIAGTYGIDGYKPATHQEPPSAPAPAQQEPDCPRCNGSGEDPEGYFDQSRGPDGDTYDGPCRDCAGTGAAQHQEPPQQERRLLKVSSIDVEAMIAACLPGGQSCDPQQVADEIRRYCNAWTPQQERKPIGYVPISAVEDVALDGYLPVYKDHDIRE